MSKAPGDSFPFAELLNEAVLELDVASLGRLDLFRGARMDKTALEALRERVGRDMNGADAVLRPFSAGDDFPLLGLFRSRVPREGEPVRLLGRDEMLFLGRAARMQPAPPRQVTANCVTAFSGAFAAICGVSERLKDRRLLS